MKPQLRNPGHSTLLEGCLVFKVQGYVGDEKEGHNRLNLNAKYSLLMLL